jgi:preprotein translocase subunit SecA
LLEYDDVMNSQREVIYARRRHALFGERLALDVSNMIFDVCEHIVNEYHERGDYEGFNIEVLTSLAMQSPFEQKEFLSGNPAQLSEELFALVYQAYLAKRKAIAQKALPVVKDVYENQTQYELISIPVTDGRRSMNVIANLKKAIENPEREINLAIEKGITLSHIDEAWKEHLREMDELKQSVQNATYEQKDPLLIYKFESFQLFKSMVQKNNKDIASFLIKGDLPFQVSQNVREARMPRATDMSQLKASRTDLLSQANARTQHQQVTQPVKAEKKVGRNDPCPCGSGKKYKHCHGQ